MLPSQPARVSALNILLQAWTKATCYLPGSESLTKGNTIYGSDLAK